MCRGNNYYTTAFLFYSMEEGVGTITLLYVHTYYKKAETMKYIYYTSWTVHRYKYNGDDDKPFFYDHRSYYYFHCNLLSRII